MIFFIHNPTPKSSLTRSWFYLNLNFFLYIQFSVIQRILLLNSPATREKTQFDRRPRFSEWATTAHTYQNVLYYYIPLNKIQKKIPLIFLVFSLSTLLKNKNILLILNIVSLLDHFKQNKFSILLGLIILPKLFFVLYR